MGSGAVIQLVPDAPVELINDDITTTDTVIRFTWKEGANNGGSPVIDYTVYYDQGTGSGVFVLLEEGVTATQYTTSVELLAGVYYQFKVTARNTVGSSVDSPKISVIAAKIPDAPINLANVPEITTGYQIGLTWQEGSYDGGNPVQDYQVSYAVDDGELVLTYSIYDNNVVSTSKTITGLTPGVVYSFKVKSRNVLGLSSFSDPISIKAAQITDAPTDLSNVESITNANQIGLVWVAPAFDGGSQLLDYRLWYAVGTEAEF